MKPSRPARLASLCLLVASLVAPLQALADGTGSGKKKGGGADAAVADAKSGFKDALADGSAKYAARDFPGSIQAFQKAIELSPKNALGHYLLGEAQLAAGNATEAEAAWNRAALEVTDKEAALKAKVLFVLADLKERQKKWDDAKTAWQAYVDEAGKSPDAKAFPGSGQSRQQKIDDMQKQDKAYAVVRQRIADTKNGNVFTDMSKAPPATPAPVPAPAAK